MQNLLRRKAAEEVKRQQEIRERERQKAISERTGKPKPTHDANEGRFGQLLFINGYLFICFCSFPTAN